MICCLTRILPLLMLLAAASKTLGGDRCFVCRNPLGEQVYFSMDRVTREKRELCEPCAHLTTVCYLCGVPTKTGFTELEDGRVICARDLKSVVLDESEAKRLSREVKSSLDRLFVRFIEFPETNVTVGLMDRVNLMALFRLPGNDLDCPNALGYTRPLTNDGVVTHEISLLSGLPAGALKATCAHEYAHTWIDENVSEDRRASLSPDSREGFCELIAYRLMESQHDQGYKDFILANPYTRGQVQLFIDASDQFGFNDVVEWMRFGVDERLDKADLTRVKVVDMPAARMRPVASTIYRAAPAAAPDSLVLRSIIWSDRRPTAMINDHTFEAKETGKVRLGETNVTLRCITIRKDAVVVQRMDTGEELELKLKVN